VAWHRGRQVPREASSPGSWDVQHGPIGERHQLWMISRREILACGTACRLVPEAQPTKASIFVLFSRASLARGRFHAQWKALAGGQAPPPAARSEAEFLMDDLELMDEKN
jgi:hypothetical protein